MRFKVKGNGTFPFDMLRYDACHPVNEDEARSLAATNTREVELVSRRPIGSQQDPTYGRWNSFGWWVSAVEDPRPGRSGEWFPRQVPLTSFETRG